MNLDKKIDYSIALLRKAESMALRLDPENGFYLAFSGGKDSQALYHIAQMAGVKFKAHMNLTSVDPPEVIRFVRRQYPDVELIKPKMSIYEAMKGNTYFQHGQSVGVAPNTKNIQELGRLLYSGLENKKVPVGRNETNLRPGRTGKRRSAEHSTNGKNTKKQW